MSDSEEQFLSNQKQASRYGTTVRTISRWGGDPQLGYPPAYDFNGRPFRKLKELQEWERSRALIAAANRAARKRNGPPTDSSKAA
jgi:hypothetical protein